MTTKETSNRLFLLKAKAVSTLDEQALDMAIKALEQTELNPSYNSIKTDLKPCEDCISREAVIKIFGEVHPLDYNKQSYIANIKKLPSVTSKPCEEENPNCTECRYYDKEKHHCPRFCQVIENTVAEITSEQARWIPANEKLPKIGKDVLATDGVEMFVAWIAEITRGKYEWQSFDENYAEYTPIKAWMPLPEPYEAESEE